MLRIASAITVIVLAAGVAHGQVNITDQVRYVQAISGNGSGSTFLSAPNTDSWNQTATRNWVLGNNSMHQHSTISPWRFNNVMSGTNAANTEADTGNILSWYRVDFSISSPIDVYTQGNFWGTSLVGTNMRLWNRTTNATILGSGTGFTHLPPGNYSFEQSATLSIRGTIDGNSLVDFRPGNDLCQYATVVTHRTYVGTTTNSTGTNDGPASCNTPESPDGVWFKYTAPRNGTLELTTCGSSFDTVLTVFNTSNCSLSSILACNDDAPAGANCGYTTRASNIRMNVSTGQTIMIRLSGYNNATGDYRFNVGPVNDNCNNMIPAQLGDNAFDNTLADTDGAALNTCAVFGDETINGDLWYAYVPTTNGLLSLNTCGSSFDTKLAIYDGYSCGVMGYMACSDNSSACSNSTRSSISNIPVVAGRTYTIRVGGFASSRGTGNLNLSMAPACAADFNQDGVVDFFDYLDFVGAFSSGAMSADFNHDGVVDFFDYLDFVSAFANGC